MMVGTIPDGVWNDHFGLLPDDRLRDAEADVLRLHKEKMEYFEECLRLRKGIQDYLDGNYGPKVGKTDKCEHGIYGFETCENCIDKHFLELLSPSKSD